MSKLWPAVQVEVARLAESLQTKLSSGAMKRLLLSRTRMGCLTFPRLAEVVTSPVRSASSRRSIKAGSSRT